VAADPLPIHLDQRGSRRFTIWPWIPRAFSGAESFIRESEPIPSALILFRVDVRFTPGGGDYGMTEAAQITPAGRGAQCLPARAGLPR